MRAAIVTGRRHGEDIPSEVLVPPGDPRAVAEAFKALILEGGGGFAEINLWDSHSGVCKGKKFAPEEAEAAPEVAPSPFAENTIEELKTLCDEQEVDHTGFRRKQEFLDALDRRQSLSAFTVAELRAQAIALGIETAGFERKHDYLVALEAHAGPAGQLAALTDAQLAEVAAKYQIASAGMDRGALIAAILAASVPD